MKKVFIISLIALMLLQAFSKIFIVIDYQLNKDFITEFLCINKDKPEMHCNGQCHLTKQLKKSDKADKQANEKNRKQETAQPLYCQDLFHMGVFAARPAVSAAALYRPGTTQQALHAVFHPPRLLG